MHDVQYFLLSVGTIAGSGKEQFSGQVLCSKLQEAHSNKRVKAVVLLIDSKGRTTPTNVVTIIN